MKGMPMRTALACCLVLAGLGCAKPKALKPRKPVPAGTVEFQFTRKVKGPIDLTVDGIRVPVLASGKKCLHLYVRGLPLGKHHLALLSALEAFGPDQVDVDLKDDKGEFVVLFSQEFNSVLYGKPEPTPPAEGIPGVVAKLEH